MSVSAYHYELWQSAFEVWRAQSDDVQDRLQSHFEWLAARPYAEFTRDYDTTGRPVSLSACGDFVTVHWVDHSLRVLQIEDITPI